MHLVSAGVLPEMREPRSRKDRFLETASFRVYLFVKYTTPHGRNHGST